jgi:hypothetical protein
MLHPYKSGYSLLPQLKKVSTDDIFLVTADKTRYLEQKKLSLQTQKCFLEHKMEEAIYDAACSFIVDHYPDGLDEPYNFCNLAMQIQEDMAIHRISDETDWLAATHICCPSSWSPEEKIGKNFNQIHEPIPGMNLSNSRKLIEAAIYHGPYERFVWGLIYEDELNYHPSLLRKQFDQDDPVFFVKVERQIMAGLPEHKSMLFVLRQFLIPEHEVDVPALHKAISGMTPEQRKYKNIPDEFLSFLGDRCINL